MADVRVILVAPKFEGNIGAVARSMANFDVSELYLVHPCKIGDDAYRRAKHGANILDNAKIVNSIKESVEGCFLVVGTSGIITKNDKKYVRIPMSVHEFASKISDYREKIAILFGREDLGLLKSELTECDILVHIPSSDTYPILNLSHAVTVVLYELFGTAINSPKSANHEEKERMFRYFDNLLMNINYPKHRMKTTSIMFRKIMGRAVPSEYEYSTIMGVFGDALKSIIENSKQNQKERDK